MLNWVHHNNYSADNSGFFLLLKCHVINSNSLTLLSNIAYERSRLLPVCTLMWVLR